MARARKCRICGYRFKENEDICPECFTARDDDISCEQFGSDEHTHSHGYSTTAPSDVYEEFHESSFIDEQRRDEASDPIPEATYNKNTAQNNFSQGTQGYQSYQQRNNTYNPNTSYGGRNKAEDVLRAIREGVRQGRYGSPADFGNAPRFQPQQFGGQRPAVKKSSVGAVIAVFIIVTFFLPVIVFIAAVGRSSNSTKNKKATVTQRPLQDFSYEFSAPDISFPDFSDFDAKEAYKVVEGKYKIMMKFIKKFVPFNKNDAAELFTEEEWATVKDGEVEELRLVTFDFRIENSEKVYQLVPEKTYIACSKATGELLCNSYLFGYTADDEGFRQCSCFIPADCDWTTAYITVRSDDNTEESVELLVRNFNYDVVKDSFGTLELDEKLESKLSDDTSSVADSDTKSNDSSDTSFEAESIDLDSFILNG